MKQFLAALLFLLPLFSHVLSAQSVSELEARLRRANSKSDKLTLNYQLAEKLLPTSPAKAAEYAQNANQIAVEVGDKRKETDAANLSADAMYRARNFKEAATRYNRAWNTARNYGFREVALNASEKLQDIALKQNDFKEALKWSRETISYLKETGGGGRSGGESQRKIENQLALIDAENRALKAQLAQLSGQNQNIATTYEEQLRQVEEKTKEQLNQQEAKISGLSQEKQSIDSSYRYATRKLEYLSKEQMIDSVVLAQQEREIQTQKTLIAEKELEKEKSDSLRNLLALVLVFMGVIAVLFYARYRAKRKTANELQQKNKLVEAEQQRSNTLLLNILPPAIAEELKARNKVAARKYDQATVMFIDFKGFTHVAEQLSPEMLVEELDFCFSNFDRIIGQYRIEKIKTIGDAYMCASGLSDMNASPSDIVKAALEIQDFMLALKAERLNRGMPYFEARVGIHVGPVVAGVVGAKKFAYDIWGDTVNIAARMEEACEPGHVNVSEAAHWLAKYEFEWQYRGKVAAKNKGMMDMYYVTSVKQF
ncbi:MAG: adenylate/guanylate cyclase domain-containing protein [Saprospiraceae bacterium]|jgi:adenylate cyclase|nr:adenylate/guanylate cyclase domain-containing protein [Saprospiraceae bacterium]